MNKKTPEQKRKDDIEFGLILLVPVAFVLGVFVVMIVDGLIKMF